MTMVARSWPATVLGVISPKPVVVIVTTVQYMLIGMLEKPYRSPTEDKHGKGHTHEFTGSIDRSIYLSIYIYIYIYIYIITLNQVHGTADHENGRRREK